MLEDSGVRLRAVLRRLGVPLSGERSSPLVPRSPATDAAMRRDYLDKMRRYYETKG